MSLNKVMLIGNLGKDPEVKYTQAQMAISNFSVATTEKRKNADGQWAEVTEWHNVVTFGKTAENCAQYLTKGKKVYVEGAIKTKKWQDKEGKDRWTTEIIANTVQFLSAKGEGGSRSGEDLSSGMERSYNSNEAPSFNPAAAGSGVAPVAFDDDDIPF